MTEKVVTQLRKEMFRQLHWKSVRAGKWNSLLDSQSWANKYHQWTSCLPSAYGTFLGPWSALSVLGDCIRKEGAFCVSSWSSQVLLSLILSCNFWGRSDGYLSSFHWKKSGDDLVIIWLSITKSRYGYGLQ